MSESVEGQVLQIMWGQGRRADGWTRTDYAKAVLSIPDIERGLELVELESARRLVELSEDQTHPVEYWTTTKLHPEGTNTTNHVIPKGVAQAYEQAGFQRVKPKIPMCGGINCDQYTPRCVAYGEPADNCPLFPRTPRAG